MAASNPDPATGDPPPVDDGRRERRAMKTRQEALEHRNQVGSDLMAELTRQGFPCHPDLVMGAFYVDLEDHDGFTLGVGREWVKSGRPAPDEYDYTGQARIEYQGFGQSKGVDLIEPDGGFDFPSLVRMLGREIRESSARRAAFLERKAEAGRKAEAIRDQLNGEFGECGPAEAEAVLVDGEWTPRFAIDLERLTESQVRVVLKALKDHAEATPDQP